VLHSLKTKAL